MNHPWVRDGALLLLRLTLGFVLFAHAWILFTHFTATVDALRAAELPQPAVMALLAGVVQVVASVLLMVGLGASWMAGLLAAMVLATGWLVHSAGFFVVGPATALPAEGGYPGFEYPMVLAVSLLMIVVFGPGRLSADEVLSK